MITAQKVVLGIRKLKTLILFLPRGLQPRPTRNMLIKNLCKFNTLQNFYSAKQFYNSLFIVHLLLFILNLH